MPKTLPFTTDDLWRIAVGFREGPHRIRLQDAGIDVIVEIGQACLYLDGDHLPRACLRFGGPRSGAIWFDRDLIGEYDKDLDGEFVLVEVENGFKLPGSQRREDPFNHLFSRVQTVR